MKGYTIQNSINLLEKNAGSGSGGMSSAEDVSFDNTGTGLSGTNVQGVIEEVNTKITNVETYSTTETVIGKWIDGRTIYRKVIDIGALPNNNTVSVAHNISDLGQFTKISGIGIASNKGAIPLPFVDDASKNSDILLDVSATNVRVITKGDKTIFSGYVYLEYTKAQAQSNTRKKK